MIYAATGHRPPKLGGYSDAIDDKLRALARDYLSTAERPNFAISGMALGWDMAWAEAAIELRIPLIAAIPCRGQASKWPAKSQIRYNLIKDAAYECFILSETYTPACMQARNEWMVDRCHRIAALWDGSPGGTANCLKYAAKLERPVDNLWGKWKTP